MNALTECVLIGLGVGVWISLVLLMVWHADDLWSSMLSIITRAKPTDTGAPPCPGCGEVVTGGGLCRKCRGEG